MATHTGLADADKEALYNAWQDLRDEASYGDLIDSIEQAVLQSPEVQALRKDAGRYRWLRDKGRGNDFAIEQEMKGWCTTHSAKSLDAAVDAAMEKPA